MSASKKYKSEIATEILHQQDTENINNCFRKATDLFGPSTSAAAAAAASSSSSVSGRIALGQSTNMQRSGNSSNVNSSNNGAIGTNGERRANFSMLDAAHINDHRSSTTTSAYFNKLGAHNTTKPGDVKKIVIKNFKGMYE